MISERSRCSSFMCLILGLVFLANGLLAQTALDDPRIEARVDALIKQMTLEEKVGQLVQRPVSGVTTGPGGGGTGWGDLAARGEIGSLFNLTKPEQVNAVQQAAMEKSRL